MIGKLFKVRGKPCLGLMLLNYKMATEKDVRKFLKDQGALKETLDDIINALKHSKGLDVLVYDSKSVSRDLGDKNCPMEGTAHQNFRRFFRVYVDRGFILGFKSRDEAYKLVGDLEDKINQRSKS